jgi:hypothetical protein
VHEHNAKQLIFFCAGMTVAVALILPDMDLLTPLGLVTLVVTYLLTYATEAQAARSVGSVLGVLAISMFLVVLGIYRGEPLTAPTNGPRTLYVVGLLVGWAASLLVEYRRWRKLRDGRALSPNTAD